MTAKSSANELEVIVIGSGMGGMTTAAALSQLDHKVLLLEQVQAIGGLTHSCRYAFLLAPLAGHEVSFFEKTLQKSYYRSITDIGA